MVPPKTAMIETLRGQLLAAVVRPLFGRPTLRIRVHGWSVFPGRQQVMAPTVGSLPLLQETQIKFLASA